MKLLTFQKPNKFYFFFLAYFISIFIRQYLNEIQLGKDDHKYKYFFRMYATILSHILSFIPHFISQYLSKRRERKNINKSSIKYISNSVPKKYKCKNLMKPILILSLLNFFSEVILYLFYVLCKYIDRKAHSLSIYSVLNTVVIYLVSYYVLKTYFYKHHYLSLTINSIGFLISLIFDVIVLVKTKTNNPLYYIFAIIRIIRLILHCFSYCLSKKAFDSSLITPFSLIAYRSIYETLFLGVFSIPFSLIPIKDYLKEEGEIIFSGFIHYFTGINLLYSFILLIDDYLIDIFTMLIIDKFSPSHFTLALTLEAFAELGYRIIKKLKEKEDVSVSQYINLGVYFILFIGSMIHNEIFIINKWDLNKKTKLYLNSEFNEEKIDDIKTIKCLDEGKEDDDKEEKKIVEMNNLENNNELFLNN